MAEQPLPVAPFSVKAAAAAIRALPSGRYFAMGWLQHWPGGAFWWRLPRDVGGYLFRCDLRDPIMREACVTGRYEPQETILLQYLLGPGHVFVDVGANWGYFTLVAASFVGTAGRVVSVEADPRACRALAANVEKNGLSSVTIVEAAADEREGVLSLNTYGTRSDDFSNYGVVLSSQSVVSMRTFDVRTRPLDDMLDEVGVTRVDVLKMDIEGAEAPALKGIGRRLAAGLVDHILLELHPGYLQERGTTAADVVRTIRAYGYDVSRVNHTPEMHRRAGAGSVPLSALVQPLEDGDDLGTWPHVLMTRKAQ